MKAFSITDVGAKRKTNQDCVYCEENAIGNFPNLFIVADGMGGHNAGDCASRTCIDCVVESIRKSDKKTPVSCMEKAISYANDKIYAMAQENVELEGMGTTMVGAIIAGGCLYVANIGDSRLYVIDDKEIRQITEDHSLVEAMIRNGEIERREARFHPNKNIITRAIGTTTRVEADFFEVELKPGYKVLICSDGLSNMIDDEDMMYIIRRYNEDIETAGRELVKKANECGGKDNISLILVQV